MAGIGHNGGPSTEEGANWRRHCWSKARADLLPTLPIEVVRGRVRRAKELGLDYKTYAGVRAATGHDVVAFLFSSNALRLNSAQAVLPQNRAAKLAEIRGADRIILAQPPLTVALVAAQAGSVMDVAALAPPLLSKFAEARAAIRTTLGKRASDTVLLVCETSLEAEWCVAARLAGYVKADRYFGPAHPVPRSV